MVLSLFNSILHDLESSPHGQVRQLETAVVQLRFLRTFLICARKWTNDLCPEPDHDNNNKKNIVSLQSSLSSLEDTCLKCAQLVGSLIRQGSDFYFQSGEMICEFENNIKSVEQEIDQMYFNLVEYCSLRSSYPDDIVELIDSLLENLKDLRWGKSYVLPCDSIKVTISEKTLRDLVRYLEERLICFKNFTRFAMWRGNEDGEMEDLFTHFEVLAVNAARVTYMYWFGKTKERKIKTDDGSLLISGLLHKIKTDDNRVLEMYIQVLYKASNSSGSSCTSIQATDILGNFVDSVFGILFEILNYRTESFTEQMQRLYEGIRFLRTILKHQQEKLDGVDEKMKDLVGVVVNDVGIEVFSLSANKKKVLSKEMDLSLFDLLEKIELIKAEVQKKHPSAATLSFPRTFEAGLIDYLLEELKDFRTSKVGSISFAEDQIQKLQENLVLLGSFLENNMKQRNQQEELQTLGIRAVEVAYKAEFVIDSLKAEKIPDASVFDSIKEEIMLFKTEALEIDLNKCSFKVYQKAAETSTQVSSQHGISTSKEVVVGLNDEVITIINQLTRGSMQLDVVSIVGMPGIGKTTFAKRIYNHPSITCYFHVRAWCCVSQAYRKKDLLLEILACICYKENGLVEKSEDDLAEYLYKKLKRNKYLIVFDDVWDSKAWHDLQNVFPNDANGSRILITSRLHKVASEVKVMSEPFSLRLLTDDESLELLQKKLFHGERFFPPTLHTLGLQIAQKCNGLPLIVVIVSGILATAKLDDWEEVSKSLSSNTVCSTEQCMNVLDLSYRHLPEYLKPCLLYFGAFPEDQEIPIQQLIWLLIAEGLVKQVERKSLEDVAHDYIMDLIDRSLVMVAKQRITGRVKTCRIHDLLHDFCVTKARKENFLQVLEGYTDISMFDEPSNLWRLCIYSEPEHFEKSRLFCPRLRSLTFFPSYGLDSKNQCDVSFVFHICKELRVLNLFGIDFYDSFPSEVELLVKLRFLAIQVSEDTSIPSSIAKLQNLETFLLKGRDIISLPSAIWKLKKLRHLRADCEGIKFDEDGLESSSDLSNLMSFSTLYLSLGHTTKQILKKLPNIRTLACRFSSKEDRHRLILRMDFLNQLEKLELFLGKVVFHPELYFPVNLKELTLSCISLSITSEIAKLPNLEFLKLEFGVSEDGIWDMEKVGVFPKLKILKLRVFLNLVRWVGADDHFPSLQKLVFYMISGLEELPSCLAYSEHLEIIKVTWCAEVLETLVREIEAEQRSLGNQELKVNMLSFKDMYKGVYEFFHSDPK